MQTCESCGKERSNTTSAVVGGKYFRVICPSCLNSTVEVVSSGAVGYDRRRQYEDYAQDTVQPYDAMGKPRSEFYRLYSKTAEGMFTPEEIEEIKRKL